MRPEGHLLEITGLDQCLTDMSLVTNAEVRNILLTDQVISNDKNWNMRAGQVISKNIWIFPVWVKSQVTLVS